MMELSHGRVPGIPADPTLRVRKLLANTWRDYVAPLLLLSFFIVLVGLPLLMAVLWSLVDPDNPWSYPNPFPPSLSLAQWEFVFKYTDIVPAIITSFTIAPFATLLAFILALPTAYAIGRYEFRGKELIRVLILLPIVLPGMVVALFLSRAFDFLGLSQTFLGLVLGHTLLGLPFMLRLLSTSFAAIPKEISDAASNLGASELTKFRHIYIPLIMPGIFAGAIFTFIVSLEEFALTFVIGTPSYQTIPTVLFRFLGYSFVRTNASVVALLLMAPTTLLLFIADRYLKTNVLAAGYGNL
ncbi:MAG TPA: ABC transporter permease [Anaerolineae bacterium]|nr:ABC transporter permease [Anaerolineae bacterium]